MNKLPECETCTLYTQYGCRLHPSGPPGSICLDCRPDYSNEGGSYLGEEITGGPRRSRAELLELLELHPLFTGHCPQCGRGMQQIQAPHVGWVCECGWRGDSVEI